MELINKLYRNVYYLTYLRGLEKQNGLRTNINRNSTIAIFSSPRGGSTWLAELLNNSIKNSSLILEPLYRGVYQTNGLMPTEHKAGLPTNELRYWYYQPIKEDEEWQESKHFFKKLLNRELLSLSVTYENKLSEIPKSNCFIFKFCYGHLLMPWLSNNFDFAGIFLVRHPGAVISSQLNHINWRHIKDKKEYRFNLPEFRNSDFFEQHEHILRKIKTPEENLAAIWAITNNYLIKHPHNNIKWKTIAYEELFLSPKETLLELFNFIGHQFSEETLSKVRNPSKTTSASFLENNKQLSGWRKHLTDDQKSRIAAVLSDFEIDFYSMDNEMPNFDIIKSPAKH
jgi:hypothetical protein